jgi:hypothetical protein
MSKPSHSTERTVALLKVQGLLAAAYDVTRQSNHDFLTYLIKMARMEAGAHLDRIDETADIEQKPGGMDRH